MKIYIAAHYDRRFEMLGVAADLVRAGHEVTSRWIEGGRGEPPELLASVENFGDLARADCLVAFTESPCGGAASAASGGRQVEFGVALATGKRLFIVGPRETVFHHLPWVEVYPSTGELIAGLKRPRKVLR
jgi:hypothetical protein